MSTDSADNADKAPKSQPAPISSSGKKAKKSADKPKKLKDQDAKSGEKQPVKAKKGPKPPKKASKKELKRLEKAEASKTPGSPPKAVSADASVSKPVGASLTASAQKATFLSQAQKAPTLHHDELQSRVLAELKQAGSIPGHRPFGYQDIAPQGRPTDTRELLALAAAADTERNIALQAMMQEKLEQELALANNSMLLRSRLEQGMGLEDRNALLAYSRMEQELALQAAAAQQQERNLALHNMAVNALMSGHTLEDIMGPRSGLPRDVAVEVAERMVAISNQLSARPAVGAGGPDPITLALLREQALQQQNAQSIQNALRFRGQFPSV